MFKNTKDAITFLDGLKPYLKSRIIGQDHVIDAVTENFATGFSESAVLHVQLCFSSSVPLEQGKPR